jgi:hypothetical protein
MKLVCLIGFFWMFLSVQSFAEQPLSKDTYRCQISCSTPPYDYLVTFSALDVAGNKVYVKSAPPEKAYDDVCLAAPNTALKEQCLVFLALCDPQEKYCQEVQNLAERDNCKIMLKAGKEKQARMQNLEKTGLK